MPPVGGVICVTAASFYHFDRSPSNPPCHFERSAAQELALSAAEGVVEREKSATDLIQPLSLSFLLRFCPSHFNGQPAGQ
jgi:hypothetical protein